MFSVLPLLSGLLFAAASLTPSLIPRDWIMQGALAGVSMAAGYLATQFLLALWRTLQIPVLAGRRATIAHAVVAVPVLAVLVRCVALADACASYFPEFHRVGLEMIKAQGGIFGWVSDASSFANALRSAAQAA